MYRKQRNEALKQDQLKKKWRTCPTNKEDGLPCEILHLKIY